MPSDECHRTLSPYGAARAQWVKELYFLYSGPCLYIKNIFHGTGISYYKDEMVIKLSYCLYNRNPFSGKTASFILRWPPSWKRHINSLWPSDAIRRQGTESTVAQVMACCLMAPSRYLNQCWLIISKVLWHSSEGIIMRSEDTNQ